MGSILTEHQIALVVVICVLVFAVIFLSWAVWSANKRKKTLNEKLSDPESLPRALAGKALLSEKIENGQGLFKQVQNENASLVEKLRFVNAKLYPPVFKHGDSQKLKTEIAQCRDQQLSCILNGNAANSYSNWEWLRGS